MKEIRSVSSRTRNHRTVLPLVSQASFEDCTGFGGRYL